MSKFLPGKLNTLEKIQHLKSFVGTNDYDESELTECLRLCGYNLERAAQKLLTGEFREARNTKKAFLTLNRSDGPLDSSSSSSSRKPAPSKEARKPVPAPSKEARKPAPHPSPKVTNEKNVQGNKKPSSSISSAPRSSRPKTAVVTPKHQEIFDLTLADNEEELDKKLPAIDRNIQSNVDNTVPLLLCRRWLAEDTFVTSRTGRVNYKEQLQMDGTTRFRGKQMEGRLPRKLAMILEPLGDFVRLSAESLMEDRHLKQGQGVPIQLTVTLVQPKAFFECMEAAMESNGVKSQHYFRQESSKAGSNRKRGELSQAEAAFQLLQWAEYGDDIPDYAKEKNLSMDDVKEDGDKFDNPDEDDGTMVSDTDESFALSGVTEIEEAPDPPGLSNGISLRPYQRQALFFMNQRETIGADRDQVDEQLNLLRELSEATKITRPGPSSPASPKASSITCDCGPVCVAKPEQASTLTGQVNPVNHPLWKRRFLSTPSLDKSFVFFVNELLGVALYKPPPPPTPCSGGILADAMGLGKTVMLIALILKSKHERGNCGPTLVVAKLSLLPQWEEELATKTNLTFRIHYGNSWVTKSELANVDVVVTTYGSLQGELSSKNGPRTLLGCKWLRVILDEAHCIRNLRTQASQACCALIADHRWCVSGTIIQNSLDDVLGIMKFLQHEPWCWASFWKAAVSDPAKESDPEIRDESLAIALDRVRRVLNPIMLRRNKDSLSPDGTPILILPPIETKVVRVELSESEREFYQAVLHRSQHLFIGFEKNGTASRSYFQIFSLLQRLRQTCDHIALTVKSRLESSSVEDDGTAYDEKLPAKTQNEGLGLRFFEELLSKFASRPSSPPKKKRTADDNVEHIDETNPSKRKAYTSNVAWSLSQAIEDNATHIEDECAICLETPKIEDAVVTQCAHVFCRECLVEVLQFNRGKDAKSEGSCPTCQTTVIPKHIITMQRDGANVATGFLTDDLKPSAIPSKPAEQPPKTKSTPCVREILTNSIGNVESTKMIAIFNELELVWEENPKAKVLIFSHYLGFLDLLAIQLNRYRVRNLRLDGSLKLKERMEVLNDFRSAPDRSVLLMSMSAGGEGLNIVSASVCFIVEPWWNSAKEDQCVNRIHRIGQTADRVRVCKFVVADTVEERIVELQKRKAYVANEAYSASSASEGNGVSARLSLDDFRLIFHGRAE